MLRSQERIIDTPELEIYWANNLLIRIILREAANCVNSIQKESHLKEIDGVVNRDGYLSPACRLKDKRNI